MLFYNVESHNVDQCLVLLLMDSVALDDKQFYMCLVIDIVEEDAASEDHGSFLALVSM